MKSIRENSGVALLLVGGAFATVSATPLTEREGYPEARHLAATINEVKLDTNAIVENCGLGSGEVCIGIGNDSLKKTFKIQEKSTTGVLLRNTDPLVSDCLLVEGDKSVVDVTQQTVENIEVVFDSCTALSLH